MKTLFNIYAESKNCYAIVKLGKMAIEIGVKLFIKSKKGRGGWTFLENIPYPYSKQQLKLHGGKQRLKSKFIYVAKESIPNNN